MVMANDIGQYN